MLPALTTSFSFPLSRSPCIRARGGRGLRDRIIRATFTPWLHLETIRFLFPLSVSLIRSRYLVETIVRYDINREVVVLSRFETVVPFNLPIMGHFERGDTQSRRIFV